MPEGDTIHKLATALTRAISGKPVVAFTSRNISDLVAKSLVGHVITRVVARGKNLLIEFDDERVLHIHLRMLGRVRIVAPDFVSRGAPQLRLDVEGASIIGAQIPVLRLLKKGAVLRVPELASLGPDLLDENFDAREALERLRTEPNREIGDALMLQRLVAGIGNVFKSEILFIEKIDPRARVSSMSDEMLLAIIECARKLLKINATRRGPRITRGALGARSTIAKAVRAFVAARRSR